MIGKGQSIGRLVGLIILLVGLTSIHCNFAYANVAVTVEHEAESFLRKLFRLGSREPKYWEFKNVSAHSARTLARYMPLPIPGKVPEIAQFLEATSYLGALRTMEKAWSHPLQEFPFEQNVDAYLSSKSGKTVVVIGHIEGDAFVFSMSRDAPRLSISALQDSAKRNNVFLIPIGCQSEAANALIGTTRNITTDEVATVLSSFPKREQNMSEFLDAFSALGSLKMDVDQTNNMLLFTVMNPLGQARASFRMPVSAVGERVLSAGGMLDLFYNPVETIFKTLEWITSSVLIFSIVFFGPGAFFGLMIWLVRRPVKLPETLFGVLLVLFVLWSGTLACAVAAKMYGLYSDFRWNFVVHWWVPEADRSLWDNLKRALAFNYIELVASIAAFFYFLGIAILCARRWFAKFVRRRFAWMLRVGRAVEILFCVLALCFGGLFTLAEMTNREASVWWALLSSSCVPIGIAFYEWLSDREGQNAAAFSTSEEKVTE